MKSLLRSPLLWLSIIAALLYSSWPWGYILDPAVERSSLASQLEAPHHPFNWLFIAMDVFTGLLLILVGYHQLRKHSVSRLNRAVISAYMIFGVLVAIAALTPLTCDPIVGSCGSLMHNYRLLIHGIASIVSVVFLLWALTLVTLKSFQDYGLTPATGGLSLVLCGWPIFGISSVTLMALHIRGGNILQDCFICLCSLSIIAVIGVLEHRGVENSKEVFNIVS